MTTPQTTAYYSTDTLGTVTGLSDASGASSGQYDSNPFGDGTASTNLDPSVAGNPFGFAGEYRDPVTGLYDLRARQYDTATGRFLTLDPLGPQDYASQYVYVADNPPGYTDPSGMKRGSGCGSLRCWFASGGPVGNPPSSGGLCAHWSGMGFLGGMATGSSCVVSAKGAHWSLGLTISGGGGAGAGPGGTFFGLSLTGSNATNVSQYGGTFVEGSVAGGDGLAATAGAYSSGLQSGGVTGGYVGLGAGGGLAGGAAFTTTTVMCWFGCGD